MKRKHSNTAALANTHTDTAPPPAAAAEPAARERVAEGLSLHLSSNSTGYRGVREHSGRFQAQRMVDGRADYLGTFGTAVEAAVAYARAAGEYQPPAVATEAEGLRLHLSSRGRTGYKGVYIHRGLMTPAQRMDAPPRVVLGLPFFAQVDGRPAQGLGSYATAVEAAVAYARAVGEYTPPPPPPAAAEPAAAPAAAEPTTQAPVTQARWRQKRSSGGVVDVDCAVDALVAAVLAGAPRAVQDPWGCLGLQRLTGREASRKRYLQLVRRLHPDRCGHPRAGECFALVEEAWRAIEARGEGKRSAG
ncbi:hypothetical protein EMIHUDRAFT_245602 [Emiliania huxleyi CCMP1516]|uniref:J domain-containing protein n=2 Tax=Emiliania huxleyi TaxID=2903 RepID=A0A0D3IX07_EMIH1|nr:hypothetical protein EMIHUDRAFT_245602 [Emiliania huxleyi CCMP1516]EOD15792.1 hypothetical protein EMIHUDRAFT_245602 [Emiliania huxleyi CCMP1516]|eukprot:XP_005768221.1 hypothetical protein EMIHUDRAFT_245602 [Emiliania huxleyi CCMP1516]